MRLTLRSMVLGAAVCAASAITGGIAGAQPARMVYNPVTGQTEPEVRGQQVRDAQRRGRQRTAVQQADLREPAGGQPGVVAAFDQGEPAEIENASHLQAFGGCDSCGDAACMGDSCGCVVGCDDSLCGDVVCGDTCGVSYMGRGSGAKFYTGFEFTFLKPHYEDNTALTLLDGNAAGDSILTDVGFEHDTELAPRVYFGWRHCDGVGLRATWWSFDHEAEAVSASPDADGFGRVSHPEFSGVDISTNIPTDVFSAASDLEATAIDIEATQEACVGGWDLVVAGGLRYADIEQGYRASTSNATPALRGTIDYRQSIDGIGPTISLGASRPLGRIARVFCRARGSVLFGDGESLLTASENIDAPPEISTSRSTDRDDLLSIGEVQVGFMWRGRGRRHTPYRPFVSIALEGQVWNGAGSATSEEGSLGFFGGTTGVGVEW